VDNIETLTTDLRNILDERSAHWPFKRKSKLGTTGAPKFGPPPQKTRSVKKQDDWVCVAEGALVPVKGRGLLPIEEVVAEVLKGVKLETLTRDGWKLITDAHDNGVRETVLVKLRSGQSVRVTPDHPIAVDGTFREAESLESGDLIATSPEDDGASYGEAKPDPMWQLIGYVVGDGTFGKRNVVAVEVGSAKKEDLVFLNDIAKQHFPAGVFSEHSRLLAPPTPKYRPVDDEAAGNSEALQSEAFGDEEDVVYEKKLYNTTRLTWTSAEAVTFFAKFGYRHGIGSPSRRAPVELFRAPKSAILGFLSGLFSADGTVSVGSSGTAVARLSSTSQMLIDDVQRLFLVLGARVSVSLTHRRAPEYHDLYTLNVGGRTGLQLLQAAQLVSTSKRAILAEAPQAKASRASIGSRLDSVVWDGVQVKVYDLSVKSCPEFIANGIVVHNCKKKGKYVQLCRGPEGQKKIVKIDAGYKKGYNAAYRAWKASKSKKSKKKS
jgi:intein/homing endonuclease